MSEQKLAELEALGEQVRASVMPALMLDDLLTKAGVGVVVIEENGKIISVNDAFVSLVGAATRADVVGLSLDLFVPDESRARHNAGRRRAMNHVAKTGTTIALGERCLTLLNISNEHVGIRLCGLVLKQPAQGDAAGVAFAWRDNTDDGRKC